MFLNKNYWLIIVLACLLVSSCYNTGSSDDEDMPIEPVAHEYDKGIFVANRGANGDGVGSITCYSRTTKEIEEDIFLKENGRDPGSVVQSISIIAGKMYIVMFKSNTVEVVDLNTFKSVATITGLDQPRYITQVSSDKAYISQWGENGFNGSIKVISLATNQITKTIATRRGPEKMVQLGTNLYVANSGGTLVDSVITKIDILSDNIVKVIDVGYAPQSMQIDKNNNLWLLNRGFDDQFNNLSRNAELMKITNDEITLSLEMPFGSGFLEINNAGDRLYYIKSGQVFKHDINSNSLNLAPFSTQPTITLGVDPQTDNVFLADGKNFQVPGEAIIYNKDGVEQERFKTGIVPSEFNFN